MFSADCQDIILEKYDNSLEEFPTRLIDQKLSNVAVSTKVDNLKYVPTKYKFVFY
jgi:hypothetical protein